VFIGHGRSPLWRDLKDPPPGLVTVLISDARAGHTIRDILQTDDGTIIVNVSAYTAFRRAGRRVGVPTEQFAGCSGCHSRPRILAESNRPNDAERARSMLCVMTYCGRLIETYHLQERYRQ
jgi:hypothetical protein